MRLSFNKDKFKYLLKSFFSLLLTWFVPTILLILIGLGFQEFGAKISSDPTKLKNIYDLLMVLSWAGSPIFALLLWILLRKKSAVYKRVTSFFVYPVTLFFVSLIPLWIRDTAGTSTNLVKATVINTKVFFVAFYIALLIGFIWNIYISRETYKKSNWWLFIVALPYLLTAIYVYGFQNSFIKFISLKNFSYKAVASMLKHVHFADIRIMNPMWYNSISLIVISTILILGVLISAFIWKKTKKWRKKPAKKEKEEKENHSLQAS